MKSELIIGVTGGIAAYKTAALVSQLVQAGAGVSVVMTEAAEHFVGPATFAALTGRSVHRHVFGDAEFPLGAHITVAQRAELLCVAPATADFLAQAAHGLAHDLLSTLMLSFTGPVLVAPAMNNQMWSKPAVQRNVEQLRRDGVRIIDPEEGWLSCRDVGPGRMAAPERIFAAIAETLRQSQPPAPNP
ncbi:MAG TPA: flavoprotein [Pirellulales bacterium]|jgi:phosphopantothenoylcysteine decarboxylase/phosphopantothenate--cysteine ligase|nr:flavoprotein [Pirellulales bacterium]